MQQKLLVLSDLHVGSSKGLMPPNFVDSEGNVQTQNEGQKYLWACFQNMLSRVAPQKIEKIVINGDITDGKQPKSMGAGLTLRMGDQKEAAVKVLEEIRNLFPAAKWYFTQGTPYHENPDDVRDVAWMLLGEKPEVRRTLTLRVGEALIRFHHEVAFRSGWLKASSLESEFINANNSVMDAGWADVDAEVRSHCHYFLALQRKTKLGVITPCWQLQTDFVTKGSPTKNIPDLGAVVLSVDDSLKSHGMCPVGYTEYLYRHPAPEVTYEEDVIVANQEEVAA